MSVQNGQDFPSKWIQKESFLKYSSRLLLKGVFCELPKNSQKIFRCFPAFKNDHFPAFTAVLIGIGVCHLT